jgi:alginate O-acetyltransferase complex protein AlgI
MVFSSHLFLFYFLPAALLLYYAAPRGLKNTTLTLASYFFYGWTDPRFLLLIAWSTLVDYCCGNLIWGHWRPFGSPGRDAAGRPLPRRWQPCFFLILSLVSNLGLLLFFKYFMFLQENLNALRSDVGLVQFPIVLVVLPAGISFYTFESISYNLDIFFGRARPAVLWLRAQAGPGPLPWHRWILLELRGLGAFACYITQFPHLVAGPIIRYQDLEKQLHHRRHTLEKFGRGVFFFCLGLGKKVLIANPLGGVADTAFAAHSLHWLDAWYGLFAYAFQIYFDFSGYSDMAVGLGLLFGFEFFRNFNSPYKAKSITDFWRRWHISLSTWLRDYLYVPLGGNRAGRARTYFNLMVVMALGGLWHGASWNFLIWGAIHGGWLALERALGKDSFYSRAPGAVRVAVTFLIVNLAWVFFRAPSLYVAGDYLTSLFGGHSNLPATSVLLRGLLYSREQILWMAVAAAIAWLGVDTWRLSKRVTPLRAALALGVFAWSVVAMSAQSNNPFLYFQF